MYEGGGDLTISSTIPNVLMEEDDETEIINKEEIVKPILTNLVGKIVEEMKIKHLQNYVQLNMEIVEKETIAQKKEDVIEDILSTCIKNVISMAKGGFLEKGE